MAGIIDHVLSGYGIRDRILGFTPNSPINNRSLTPFLNNSGSLLSVELCNLEN